WASRRAVGSKPIANTTTVRMRMMDFISDPPPEGHRMLMLGLAHFKRTNYASTRVRRVSRHRRTAVRFGPGPFRRMDPLWRQRGQPEIFPARSDQQGQHRQAGDRVAL